MTKVIFFGASHYSLPILQKLLTLADFQVPLIVTKTDKASGRDQKITPNPVAQFCQEQQLPLLQVDSFDSHFLSLVSSYSPDLGLCVAFGPPFFDQATIDLFPKKIINIHPSPLPRYRGATPGPWQIIKGEENSAVTFFQIDLLPDHGPIIASLPLKINPDDTAGTFYNRAFQLAADHLDTVLKNYLQNPTQLQAQDHSQKSYFPKITKKEAKIDWQQSPKDIYNFIRALNPFPIAWTTVSNSKQQILKMKIFSADFDSATQTLTPKTVQIEGKNKTDWSQISSHYIPQNF